MEVRLFRDHPAEGWISMDRYADNLAAALAGVLPSRWRVTMPQPPFPGRNVYARLAVRTLRYPLWARRRQAQVNHVLDHSAAHLLYGLDPDRTVVTVHDIAPRRFPGRRLGVSGLAWKIAWHGLRRARHVITVSRFVAEELGAQLGLSDDQIHVVYNGVSPRFQPFTEQGRAAARAGLVAGSERILLHVGGGQPRKNLSGLIRAVACLRQQGESVMLLQAGAAALPSVVREIAALGLSDAVRLLGPVPESRLIELYNAADAFVFPSFYEGFGLPVLEAMACGVPVIAGNTASLPEVAGDAGMLADPEQPEELARAIMQVLHDASLRERLRRRGLERARAFSWERTALETLCVYRRCAR